MEAKPENLSRIKLLSKKLQDAGIDLFKHRELYEWIVDALNEEYKEGLYKGSSITKEVYKLETK